MFYFIMFNHSGDSKNHTVLSIHNSMAQAESELLNRHKMYEKLGFHLAECSGRFNVYLNSGKWILSEYIETSKDYQS